MDDMPDMEQLGKIINAVKTAKMLGGLMQNEEQPGKAIKEPDAGMCAFDMELQSPAISSIKAAIPYLDYKYQKNMGIIVKLMEMDRLINHYTVIAAKSGEDKSREMLAAVKKELPEQSRPVADLLMKIMEIKNIAESLKGVEFN
jgi:hypothetical protein